MHPARPYLPNLYSSISDIETTFLIPSGGHDDVNYQFMNFIVAVAKRNGIDAMKIGFLKEEALGEDGDKYDVFIGDPINVEYGGTEQSAVDRMARMSSGNAGKSCVAREVLPSSIHIRCHFVNADKLIGLSTLISDDNVHGLKIAEVVNRYATRRMREPSAMHDMRRKVPNR